uniref:NADH-ubiquinone oxidoreductase chain 6 n=1 Tax=Galerucinae sp. 1 ACP-2013 TaxID=1434514 RepID=A0A3G3FY86_9CUCU|nr:NADH dehydrogenase subunit 6 [Galerucinae sp. 1 ACP-2013]
MSMFMTIISLYSMMFIFMKHPLSCGLHLLIQTILIVLITGSMNMDFWYSYILFLIMIGGMLILFMYMTSIASNEKFKFNMKLLILFNFSILIILLMTIFFDQFYFNSLIKMNEIYNYQMNYNNSMSMMKYLNFPHNFIMLMMIIYLFVTLIAIVKITNITKGPLRQKF